MSSRMSYRPAPLRVALLLILALAAACGGGDLGPPPPGAIVIEMGNFFFKPAEIVLKAGERATLRLNNPSTVEHDFYVGQQPDPAAARYAVDLLKDVEVQSSGKARVMRGGGVFRVLVQPLGSAEITFTVPDRKGTYEIGCFLPGHYQGGMKATLVVE